MSSSPDVKWIGGLCRRVLDFSEGCVLLVRCLPPRVTSNDSEQPETSTCCHPSSTKTVDSRCSHADPRTNVRSLCRAASAVAVRLLPCRGVPMKWVCAPCAAVPKAPAFVLALSGLVFFWASLGPGIFASETDHSRVRVSAARRRNHLLLFW